MEKLERLIEELQGGRERKHHSPLPKQSLDENPASSQDPWARLADLEARLRAHTTESTSASDTEEDAPSTCPTEVCSEGLSLDWRLLDRELARLGLPCILLDSSDDGLPSPEAAHTALVSALREISRLERQAQSLKAVAGESGQREAAAQRQAQLQAQNQRKLEREQHNMIAKAQEEAAKAKEASAAHQAAAQQAAAENAMLRTSLDRLQRQLFAKEADLEALKQQLQEHIERDSRHQAVAKDNIERIRRAFAAQRINSSAANASRRQPLVPAANISGAKLSMLQVAKIYESQLEVAEGEARAARAELFLLRQSSTASDYDIPSNLANANIASRAAREVSQAQEAASRLQEEVDLLKKELQGRPLPEDLERAQRQVEILTRRLARLEKENEPSKTSKSYKSEGLYWNGSSVSGGTAAQRASGSKSMQLPRQVLLEVVDDMCRLFQCADPLKLSSSARDLRRLVDSTSALQSFVDGVCSVVFKQGQAYLPWSFRSREDPSDVANIITRWLHTLEQAEQMQATLRALRRQLTRRPLKPGATKSILEHPESDCGADIISIVSQLIDFELKVSNMSAAEVPASNEPPQTPLKPPPRKHRQTCSCSEQGGSKQRVP